MLVDFYIGLAVVIWLIVIGFCLSKLKIINEAAAKFLSNFILMFTLPVSFFSSFPEKFHFDDFKLFIWGLGSGVIILSLLILISQLLFREKFTQKKTHEYKFAFVFNNTSFIGYPIVSMAYGQDGLVTYAGFMLPWAFAIFTYGVSLFKEDYKLKDLIKALLNPNIIAISLGALVFIFSTGLPLILSTTTKLISSLTTPLALFSIGFMLYQTKISNIFRKWQIIFVCLLQLTVPAILTFFFLKSIGAPDIVISVLVLMQSLPTAATLGLFAQQNNNTESEAGEIVTLSTLLASITVPIIIYLLIGNI